MKSPESRPSWVVCALVAFAGLPSCIAQERAVVPGGDGSPGDAAEDAVGPGPDTTDARPGPDASADTETPDVVGPGPDVVDGDVAVPGDIANDADSVGPDIFVTPAFERVSAETMSYFVGQPLRTDLIGRLTGGSGDFSGLEFRLEVRAVGAERWIAISQTRAATDGFVKLGVGLVVTETEQFLDARLVSDAFEGLAITFNLRAGVIRGIATGASHSCVYTIDGELYCWGDNGPADVGPTEVVAPRPLTNALPGGLVEAPVLVPTPGPVTALSISGAERVGGGSGARTAVTCISVSEGPTRGTFCTGSGTFGGLGSGTTDDVGEWQAVRKGVGGPALPPATHLASGSAFTCAAVAPATGNHEVWCWGANLSRQLGSPSLGDAFVTSAVRVSSGGLVSGNNNVRVHQLVAGRAHACAQYTASLASQEGRPIFTTDCWGANDSLQMGRVNNSNPVVGPGVFPSPIPPLCEGFAAPDAAEILNGQFSIRDAAAGDAHSCALVELPNLTGSQIGTLDRFCPGVAAKTYVVCAGSGSSGQTGNSEPTGPPSLLDTNAGKLVTGIEQLAAGDSFTCGRFASGTLQCWGDNLSGQLGISALQVAQSPLPLNLKFVELDTDPGPMPAVVLGEAAAASHGCVVARAAGKLPSDAQVFCWGAPDGGASGPPLVCNDEGGLSRDCWHIPRRLVLR